MIVIGVFVYKEMTFEHMKLALIETTRSTAGVMLIIMACSAFAWILTWEQVAQGVAGFITGFSTSPVVFLLVLNVFLLILGMFVEGNAAIIVLVPLLMPTVKLLGIDPIQSRPDHDLELGYRLSDATHGYRDVHRHTDDWNQSRRVYPRELALARSSVAGADAGDLVPAISTWLPNL